jgi:hypothetical protein
MSIIVKFGIASTGHGGFIEQPKVDGLDVRVFEILDSGQVQFRYYPEWHRDGQRARSYGCSVQADQLVSA